MPFKGILSILLILSELSSSSTSEAAPQHHVPDGFILEKVAGDQEVVFPMFAALDDRGRLFVTESSGLDLYAEVSALSRRCRVRLLEDRDGDERYESSKVFADRLVFPMGIAWREGKLYVADPPDLIVLEDKDGDGRADERTVILTGFGHEDNGSLHGVTFGPDGMLYMTLGSPDGYQLAQEDGSLLQGESGALIRCRSDGSRVEVLCRGFVNLVEIAFLPTGECLGTDNWFQLPTGGLRDGLVHLVEGGLYPGHPDKGTPQPVTGARLPAVSLFPAVALSGLMRYRGAGFPAEMVGNLFSAQHNTRKIGRHVLSRQGSTFRSDDFDFVWSEDPDFHPSDVLEDADGSLLVLDTGGWYVQHCPTGKIRGSRAPGGIYRARFSGAKPVDDPWGLKVEWQKLPVEDLCRRLSDPRPPVRERAREALALRGEGSVLPLASLLKTKVSAIPLENAVWALAAVPGESPLRLLREALLSPEPEVKALAAKALASRGDRRAGPALCGLLSHPDPQVRMAATEALGRCGDSSAAKDILKALGAGVADADRFFEHALIHALYRLAKLEDLELALKEPSPRVQKAALLLLDQAPRQQLTEEMVISRLSSPDVELRQTALQILGKHAEWVPQAVGLVKEWIQGRSASKEDAESLRDLILSFAAQPEIAGLLNEALTEQEGKVPSEHKAFLLETMAQASLPVVPRPWVEALERLLGDDFGSLRPLVVRAAAVLQIAELDERLLKIAEDPKAAIDLRLEALRGVIPRHPRLQPSSFELLLGNLSHDASPISRLAAAEVMARSNLDDSMLKRLIDAIRDDALVSPSLLLNVLDRSATEEASPALLDYLSEAVQKGWRPRERDLEKALDRLPRALEGKAKAKSILELLRKAREDQREVLARYEPLLAGGDRLEGRAVFFGKKVACSTCHRVGNEGGQVGPDLTKVGAVRSGRDILESIVVPSSTIAQGYESYALATKDGRVATGILARQSADAVVLRDSSGKDWRIPRDEIQEMERSSTSLMPDGLDRAVSQEELRDLLGFLVGLK